MKTPKIKIEQYLGHNYLKITVTNRTAAGPMRPMKANQIALSTTTAPTVCGVSAQVYTRSKIPWHICECEIALVKFHPEALVLLTHF